MEDKILYHGSRGGIEGDIQPNSRERCDFGKGFYMGTNPLQAKSLVIGDSEPVFYIRRYAERKHYEGKGIVQRMSIRYRNQGKYLDEMISDMKYEEKLGGKNGRGN